MHVPRIVLTAAAVATVALGTAAGAKAVGIPQRSNKIPSGLLAAFQRDVPGLLNAYERTRGSNSRLQDLPASP